MQDETKLKEFIANAERVYVYCGQKSEYTYDKKSVCVSRIVTVILLLINVIVMAFPIIIYRDNTNIFCIPFAVVAAKQDGGRGRLGRSFFSPEGGVYMSLVISGSSVSAPDMITTAASLGTARAIEALTGIECSIKWVNDIYIRGRKAVGILTEGIVNMEEGGLDKAIIGIGVNLRRMCPELPEDIKDKAVYLYPDGDGDTTRSELASRIADEVMKAVNEDFIDEYRRRCFIIGRDIKVIKNGYEEDARAIGVDDRAHLVVKYIDGREEALSSGEVTLRI